jgi:CDGSH-type Zn-finger protein
MVTIKVQKNGHYRIEGDDVRLVDWNADAYHVPNRRSFALCRCGASTNKPFCDGTHSRIGFEAAQSAVPRSQDNPAE